MSKAALRRVTLVLFASLVFGGANAVAQQESSPPTDNDLMAGYCLGVVRTNMARIASQPTGPGFSASDKTTAYSAANESYRHIVSYLFARGYVYGTQSPQPIMMAEARGTGDQNACWRHVSDPRVLDTCSKTVNDPGALFECINDTKECGRANRCAAFVESLPM
jgi:hypothetical protein